MYKNYLKRFIDFIIATVCLVLFSPLIVTISIVLLLLNRGTPFFLQQRPGKDGQTFKVIKFKTMNDKKDLSGRLLADEQRLTAFGLYVRKLSLDEIPQLINVIKGDMSLVGPRPLLVEYLTLFNEHQRRRHEVRPGITGWAQVNGRNAISWEQKFDFDVWYVQNISFRLDIKIIFMTVIKVFKSEGINGKGEATMSKFRGNLK